MVAGWDRARRDVPAGQAVMITDASNKERDKINAIAQEHRARAGELGAHQIELPGKPCSLRAGDEIIFSAQHHPPGQERVENGITGTILDTRREENDSRVTIKTREHQPREVEVNTKEFSELSLGYAVHAYKSLGLTAEHASVLTGGWQTDRESAYVALTRARETTEIYVSREDLGEQGLDPGAVERLAERMQQSHAQEATITKQIAERENRIEDVIERSHTHEPTAERDREPTTEHTFDHDRDNDRGFGIE